MRRLVIPLFVAAALAIGALPASAGNNLNGNGAPSGPHYNLNLIGYGSPNQTDQIKQNGNTGAGNVIHVPLYAHCKIGLTELDTFDVLDNNCTDDGNANFGLPDPCPTTDNCSTPTYSVFAAARGNPLGSATETTCFTENGVEYCNTGDMILQLAPKPGKNSFSNVTKYLLYVYACINGSITRTALFDDSTSNWYWDYNNNGLRVAQLRFYPNYQTTVEPASGNSC